MVITIRTLSCRPYLNQWSHFIAFVHIYTVVSMFSVCVTAFFQSVKWGKHAQTRKNAPHEIHCVFFLQMLGGTSPLEALPLLLFLWCHISLPADMLLRGEEKYLVLLCFPLCLSSYIAALCLSHSLYGKGISCANKGGNVARWALGKFSDIQEERDEAQSAYCTLPQQRQHKGPNHCSTSLAGKQPVCCPFWYLHCGVCDSIYGFLQKRKIKSETRERERAHSRFLLHRESFRNYILSSVWC